MKEIITALILAAILAACTHTTRVKYESPWGRTIEIERNAEYGDVDNDKR